MNVVHRDLKLENILFQSKQENIIKLTDFGSSGLFPANTNKKIPQNLMLDTVGTAYYIAPEVLNDRYDEKCDIWSIGVILFMLLSGRPPFEGTS